MPDYRVPERMTTYREAMDAAYADWSRAAKAIPGLWRDFQDAEVAVEERGMELARKKDVDVAGTRYIARHTPPKTEDQKKAVMALYRADNEYQKAKSDAKHWEWCYRERAAQLDANPEMANEPLDQRGGDWLKFAGRKKPVRHWAEQNSEDPF